MKFTIFLCLSFLSLNAVAEKIYLSDEIYVSGDIAREDQYEKVIRLTQPFDFENHELKIHLQKGDTYLYGRMEHEFIMETQFHRNGYTLTGSMVYSYGLLPRALHLPTPQKFMIPFFNVEADVDFLQFADDGFVTSLFVNRTGGRACGFILQGKPVCIDYMHFERIPSSGKPSLSSLRLSAPTVLESAQGKLIDLPEGTSVVLNGDGKVIP